MLRAQKAFAEDQSVVPNTHYTRFTTTFNSSFKNMLLWLFSGIWIHVHIAIYTLKHICAWTSTITHISTWMCSHTCTWTCSHTCTRVCTQMHCKSKTTLPEQKIPPDYPLQPLKWNPQGLLCTPRPLKWKWVLQKWKSYFSALPIDFRSITSSVCTVENVVSPRDAEELCLIIHHEI